MFKYIELNQKIKIDKTLYFESLILPQFRLYLKLKFFLKIIALRWANFLL